METRWGPAVPRGYVQFTCAAATAPTLPKGSAPGEADPSQAQGKGGVRFAVLVCEIGDVRWRDDGTDPTAAIGMLLTAGTILVYTGKVSKIKFIEAVPASGAKVNASLYG